MKKVLERLGFEKKESKIYLALLKLGSIGVGGVSKETGIERTLCYSILQKLIDKGMVSYILKGSVKQFSASNPEKLLQDLKEKQEEFEKILPNLMSLTKAKRENTSAEIYQGKEGLKSILKDVIKEKKDYLVFGEEGRFQEVLPIYSEQFMKKIEEAKIKERVLVQKGKKIVKSKNSRFRYVSKEYLSPTSTIVYGSKIAIMIWSEPFLVVLIENKEVADSYKNYFELLWKIV